MVSDDECTWLSVVGAGADALGRECYSEYDGGEYVIFRPATTRKVKIVPPLTEALEKRSREEDQENNKSGTE